MGSLIGSEHPDFEFVPSISAETRLVGRWLVARNEEGNPRYSLIVEQSPTFVAYLSPSGTRRITSVAGVRRIVESGKAVLV